jgi:hypothetical protein
VKNTFVVLLVVVAGYFGWQKFSGGGKPMVIENPVFGEMRLNLTQQGREIEMAMFVRMASEEDCRLRAYLVSLHVLDDCPGCKLQPAICHAELAPRYARLFDDVPIPSTYLSMSAGTAGERDGRLVVYGLTDSEGALICDQMRTVILNRYKGTAHCVAASGG